MNVKIPVIQKHGAPTECADQFRLIIISSMLEQSEMNLEKPYLIQGCTVPTLSQALDMARCGDYADLDDTVLIIPPRDPYFYYVRANGTVQIVPTLTVDNWDDE